jgi:hypothetical protein
MKLMRPDDLPNRAGPLPKVQAGPPQQQLDQLPSADEWAATRKVIEAWPTADKAPSKRSVPGTVGLSIPAGENCSTSPEAFLFGREFAHHHPMTDGGFHMVLPPDWHGAAITTGWAAVHPWAGQPTVSPQTVLVYAPRDEAERQVVIGLIQAAERLARNLPLMATYLRG